MKKLIASSLLTLALASGAFAQGTVTFKNFGTGSNGAFATPARVTLESSGASLTGAQYQAQLWDFRDANNPVALTPIVGFGSGPLAGTFAPSASIVVPNAAPGTAVTFRVLAWDNTTGSGLNATIFGLSQPFTVTVADPLAPSQPILIGMNSFAISVVPEPSVIALAVLGAGALLLRRRKA